MVGMIKQSTVSTAHLRVFQHLTAAAYQPGGLPGVSREQARMQL